VSRLSLRLRLTLAFALAMAVVLAGVGALLHARLGDSLLEHVDDALEARADVLAEQVRTRALRPTRTRLVGGEEHVSQTVSRRGTVFASSLAVEDDPLVSREERARAAAGPFFVTRERIPGLDEGRARLGVFPADEQTLVVVGASLEDRDEALDGLLTQLLVVGPLALLATSLAGWLLAGAALRPVEAMRARAAAMGDEPGERLPLPRARDEIRRLGETLNAMLGRLEIGRARERRFVADASHELRTPLALLRTELELSLRRPRSPEELEGSLRSAADEVDRLARLADDLLVLSRLDDGRLPLQRSEVSTQALLANVARRFSARAEEERRAVEVVEADGAIVADAVHLEQALGNLVDNALRHGAGTVRLTAEQANGAVELRVTDQGAGFPAEFLPRAFERFARADEARGGGTAGLGLAIVDAVARAHGGAATAENGVAGAVVSLRLPT
jgi:two-component system, OmpR family, sensor kinase